MNTTRYEVVETKPLEYKIFDKLANDFVKCGDATDWKHTSRKIATNTKNRCETLRTEHPFKGQC